MESAHPELAPGLLALIIIMAVVSAGVAHTIWLRLPLSRRFQQPIDGYRVFRGKRIFGDNKTLRGFMVMVPATGIAFLVIGVLKDAFPNSWTHNMWSLSPIAYGLLGLWAGFGFMLGELPNSFLKRQLEIAPGEAPPRAWYRPFILLLDRIDSIIGLLIAISFVVTVPWKTWMYVLLIGPVIHLLFSAWLYSLRIKARPT